MVGFGWVRSVAGAIVVMALAAGAVGATSVRSSAAAPSLPVGATTSYPQATVWGGLAAGPDGSMWFVDEFASRAGRVKPDGTTELFSNSSVYGQNEVVAGPDGAMWFGGTDIERIDMDGVITTIALGPNQDATDLTVGADGAIWFAASTHEIGRVTTAGVVSTFTNPSINDPVALTLGPDGAVWFVNDFTQTMGRITTAGVVTVHIVPEVRSASSMITGPDGALWVVQQSYDTSLVRVTTDWAVTVYADARFSGGGGITIGADGAMWFGSNGGLGRVTTDGTISRVVTEPTVEVAALGNDVWTRSNAGGRHLVKVNIIGAPTVPQVNAAATPTGAEIELDVEADGGAPITSMTVTAAPGGATCTWTSGPQRCSIDGLAPDVDYTFTATATNANGTTPMSAASAPIRPGPSSAFHSQGPVRILDSRTGLGFTGPLQAGAPQDLVVAGTNDVPANATAVVMNVTVTEPSDGSYLTAWPTGHAQPASSNINFGRFQTIANLVTVKVGYGGAVRFRTAVGATHVVADLVGYYAPGAGDLFTGIAPLRVLDSRTPNGGWSSPIDESGERDLTLTGPGTSGAIPPSATAIVANLTVTEGTGGSYLRVWPTGSPPPTSSTINFARFQTIPNLVTVGIGTGGKIHFANAIGSVHVILDVLGYYDATSGSRFRPVDPQRFLDSRSSVGAAQDRGWTSAAVQTAGRAGVPRHATAVAANVTSTDSMYYFAWGGLTAGGWLPPGKPPGSYLTVYPGGTAKPVASNVNFAWGETIANGVIVKIGQDGTVVFDNETDYSAMIADVAGYFEP